MASRLNMKRKAKKCRHVWVYDEVCIICPHIARVCSKCYEAECTETNPKLDE